jgi:hypothetical protein
VPIPTRFGGDERGPIDVTEPLPTRKRFFGLSLFPLAVFFPFTVSQNHSDEELIVVQFEVARASCPWAVMAKMAMPPQNKWRICELRDSPEVPGM